MKNNLRKLLMILGLPAMVLAQTHILTTTTLNSAVADANTTSVQVVSGTGIAGVSGFSPQSFIYVDHEMMAVQAVNPPNTTGVTTLSVIRGVNGTPATPHQTGMLVWIGQGNWFSSAPAASTAPSGTCTAAAQDYYPHIHLLDGRMFTCSAEGRWGYAGPGFGDPQIGGSRTVITATYTAKYYDFIIEASSGTFTLTLPAAAALPGKVFYLANPGGGTVTVTTATGCASIATTAACRVYSNGTAWIAF